MEGPSLEDYHPAGATSKWWKGGQRTRRPDFGEQMAALDEVWEEEDVTSDSEMLVMLHRASRWQVGRSL